MRYADNIWFVANSILEILDIRVDGNSETVANSSVKRADLAASRYKFSFVTMRLESMMSPNSWQLRSKIIEGAKSFFARDIVGNDGFFRIAGFHAGN